MHKNELLKMLYANMPGPISALDFFPDFLEKIGRNLVEMGSAHSGLRDGPRMSTVRQFGKKMWPLFYAVIASARASQRTMNELRAELWQKVVATFVCFECQWMQLGQGFAMGQEIAPYSTLAKSCGHFFLI